MPKRKSEITWSDADNERLITFVKSGGTPARASVMFKRTMMGVRDQARKLGHPFPTILERRRMAQDKLNHGTP